MFTVPPRPGGREGIFAGVSFYHTWARSLDELVPGGVILKREIQSLYLTEKHEKTLTWVFKDKRKSLDIDSFHNSDIQS